jgi:hypothetical protein
MLLQALLSVAFIAILAGAILTSALVDVKVAAHDAAARISDAALARGSDEFVNWAQLYVARHGAAATWPTTTVTDTPVPACAQGATCTSFVTVTYAVAGSSIATTNGPDPAQNLQVALAENRIAGTVTATITDAAGNIESARTRFVTIRVFNAAPFAVLTGARDATSMAGSAQAAEGDTGGYRDSLEGTYRATPNPENPSVAKDTTLTVTMTCTNSTQNSDSYHPFLDNHSPGNDARQWGASGGSAFETPCAPSYSLSSKPRIPADAIQNNGNTYQVGSFNTSAWAASKNQVGAWPR